jgi:DNA-3-methyladenine glycosylase II
MRPAEFQASLRLAQDCLARDDLKLAKVIAAAGPCTLTLSARLVPFEALLSSICHQQLNGKAAQTILGRVHTQVGKTAQAVHAAPHPALRACGLSTNKTLAVKDLAAKVLDGTVPTGRALHRMSDAEAIARLTQVRGIGQWTVEMLLMFHLGRLDVLPVDDFGVRNGFTRLYRKRAFATKAQLAKAGERWKPYRTVAAWYLWRATELETL